MSSSLFPVQNVVRKLVQGEPLDDTARFTVRSFEPTATSIAWSYEEHTEKSYVNKLYNIGRCNVHPDTARRHQHVVLVMGRRSGKSTIAAALLVPEMERRAVTHTGHMTLSFVTVSDTRSQADLMFRLMTNAVLAVPSLAERLANDTATFRRFQTDQDIERTGPWVGSQRQAAASLQLAVRTAMAKGLRGGAFAFLHMDEPDSWYGRSAAEEVYLAGQPSTVACDGILLIAGTPIPAKKDSWFRKMASGKGGLSLSIPTWEMNPVIPEEYFEERYEEDPALFWAEYGACFVEEVPAYRVVNGPFGSDLAGNLVEQMRRTARGEKDLHDRVVETYKSRVRSTGAESKHLQDYPVGMLADGRVVPYTQSPPPPEASEGRTRVGVGMNLNEIGRQHCAWQDRNFDGISPLSQALALAEETGEVARVILKTHHGIRSADRGDAAEELADVILVATGLAARLGIDIEAAIQAKAARRDKKDFRARPETG